MKNLIMLSKCLQTVVLLAFFLPFFPPSCQSKQAQKASNDSCAVLVESRSTKTINSDSALAGNLTKMDTLNVKTHNSSKLKNEVIDEEDLSERLSNKSSILKFLLRPNDNYTGIGYTLDVFQKLFGFGVAISFILLIIGLIIKIKDYNNIFHFINSVALIILFLTKPALYTDSKLWGFWVCLTLGFVLLAYDTVVLILIKKNRKKLKEE